MLLFKLKQQSKKSKGKQSKVKWIKRKNWTWKKVKQQMNQK